MASSGGQSPDDLKLGWQYSNLKHDFKNYTDLLSGEIFDSEIEKVVIVTDTQKEFDAEIIEDANGNRFWYVITDGEVLLGSTISGRISDGEIKEQISI